MNKNRFYITTAIPYVNAAPHIGHALEFVQTDVLARYHRLIGNETYFLSGTDENALKNVQAAEKAGIPVQKLVDQNSQIFYNLKDALNISFDDFIRTTEERHVKGAQKLWAACEKDIYNKSYRGLYCVGCETFYTEKELIGGKCPEHGTVPEVVEEENYFFKLSAYQDQLEKIIKSDELKIVPETRKNEVLSFINQGLEDFSISRSKERAKGWGVPVPGDESQVIYVWFDALSNYINGLGYAEEDGELFKKFWLENLNRVHVIGKGILRFHTVYWPAMLLSAELPLPTQIFVHGYLTVERQKISKSLGNVIDPFALVKKYGTDPLRYYLLAKFSPFEDGDFSEEKLKETYNADLANGIGNVVSRLAKLCENSGFEFENEHPIKPEEIYSKEEKEALEDFWLSVLQNIWSVDLSIIDEHISQNAPWNIKDQGKLKTILQEEVDLLRKFATKIRPFLPETAVKIEKQFSGPIIKSAKPLFPRRE